LQGVSAADAETWLSDPYYPSPWMNPHADGWADAHRMAKDFVSQLTLLEKVNLTTGVG
jgi:beta-glucosidase